MTLILKLKCSQQLSYEFFKFYFKGWVWKFDLRSESQNPNNNKREQRENDFYKFIWYPYHHMKISQKRKKKYSLKLWIHRLMLPSPYPYHYLVKFVHISKFISYKNYAIFFLDRRKIKGKYSLISPHIPHHFSAFYKFAKENTILHKYVQTTGRNL